MSEMIDIVIYKDMAELKNSIDFLRINDGNKDCYGGNQQWFKEMNLRKTGCSIVAAANITAYMAMRLQNLQLYNYEDMSRENFIRQMESIAEFIHPDAQNGVVSIAYFNDKIIEFAKSRGISLESNVITTNNSFEENKNFLKKALLADKPVALLMLKNSALKEFEWHWMTVTKLFENFDKTYLDFSTWGERRIFTLENFYEYSSFGAFSYFNVCV